MYLLVVQLRFAVWLFAPLIAVRRLGTLALVASSFLAFLRGLVLRVVAFTLLVWDG